MSTIYISDNLRCRTRDIVKLTLNGDNKLDKVFVVPEGIKASIERMVTEVTRCDEASMITTFDGISVSSSLVNGDVLSFVRLAVRLLESCGRDAAHAVDDIMMRNAVYRVLYEHAGQFRTFGKLVGKFEYVDMLIDLIGDFTRYGIDEDGICAAFETAETEADSRSVYTDKLHDIKLLMAGLKALGEENGMDFLTDPITEACKLLKEMIADDSLREDRIYRPVYELIRSSFTVIGFGSFRLFTPQELEFISLMDKLGADWSFYPVYSEEENGEDQRVYSYGNQTVKRLAGILSDCSVIRFEDAFDLKAEEVDDDREILYDAALRYALEDEPSEDKADRLTSSIVLSAISSSDDRIAYISNEIIRLTRLEGYRYKDIRIVCADNALLNELTGIMKIFGLDIFVDRRIVLTNTPVYSYAVTLTELPLHGYEYTDLLRLIRTGLAGMLPGDCDIFENYCVKCNITNGSRIYDKDFFIPDYSDEKKLKYLDRIYRDGTEHLVGPYLWNEVVERVLIPLRKKAEEVNEAVTLKGKAEALGKAIDDLCYLVEKMAHDMVDRGDSERASALVMGYREVMNILAAFASPMNDIPISQEAFVSLLRIDMRNKAQGTIPLMVDSVEITPVEQAFMTECKVLFLLGANEGNFPYSSVNEGIMTQDELNLMAGAIGVELPDKALSRNLSEFISSALMFSCVKDRLYIVDEDVNEASSASSFMRKFSSDDKREAFYSPLFGTAVKRRHDHINASIDEETMHELLADRAPASVTSIESYNTCPMQYMLRYILNITQRDNALGIKANVMGTIVHAMFETSVKRIVEKYQTPEELLEYAGELMSDPKKAEDEAKIAFDEYCKESNNPNEKTYQFSVNPGRKAMRIFARALPKILEEAGNSGYMPSEFEAKINEFESPLRFTAFDGSVFDFKGSIDRVDKKYGEDGLRIIDYKTGVKKVENLKVLAGIQLQLFAYADALEQRGDKVDAVGYCQIGLAAGKEGKGPTLAPDIAKLSEEELRVYIDYSRYVIQRSCDSIARGEAGAVVNSKAFNSDRRYSACGMCPYSGACGNDAARPSMQQRAYLPGKPGRGEMAQSVIDEMNRRMEGREDIKDG